MPLGDHRARRHISGGNGEDRVSLWGPKTKTAVRALRMFRILQLYRRHERGDLHNLALSSTKVTCAPRLRSTANAMVPWQKTLEGMTARLWRS